MTANPLHDALDNLKNHQQQLDEDGVIVGISKQTLDEMIDFTRAALAQPSGEPKHSKCGNTFCLDPECNCDLPAPAPTAADVEFDKAKATAIIATALEAARAEGVEAGKKLKQGFFDLARQKRDEANQRAEKAEAALETLKTFARFVLEDIWDNSYEDGGSIQDKAEQLGLLTVRTVTQADHEEGRFLEELDVGDPVYVFSEALASKGGKG